MRRRSAATLGAALAAFLFAACDVERGAGKPDASVSDAGEARDARPRDTEAAVPAAPASAEVTPEAGPAADAPPGVAVQVAGWRVDGSGVRPDADPPHEWSLAPRKNVRWEAEVGASYASPIVVKDRVFVTAEPDLLVCVARSDGKELWRARSSFDELPPEVAAALEDDEKAPRTQAGYATPTPVFDGGEIFIRGGAKLYCVERLAEGLHPW